MANFPESKRIKAPRPRPTQGQLSRLSNREFNEMAAKHPRHNGKTQDVGCLGRMSRADYERQFTETMGTVKHQRRAPRKKNKRPEV